MDQYIYLVADKESPAVLGQVFDFLSDAERFIAGMDNPSQWEVVEVDQDSDLGADLESDLGSDL